MSPRLEYDLAGQKFGMLTVRKQVASIAKNKKKSARYFECVCECGKVIIVRSDTLRLGKQVSCGCRKKSYEHSRERTKWTPEEHVIVKRLIAMKNRCNCKTNKYYHVYGGKGIKVYEPWLKDPRMFIEWCKYNGFNSDLAMERIDKNGDFEPGNIRFVEKTTYDENEPVDKRTGHFITVDGERDNVWGWSNRYCICRNEIDTIYERDGHDAAAQFIKSCIDYINKNRPE